VELTVLLTGQEPHMHHYSLTRKNMGVGVERTKAYKYQSLAHSFINRKAEPFLVVAEPKGETAEICLNTHPGQEFNFILKGRLKINLDGKEMILEEGDSIYFDSGLPHGMLALDGIECQFLALIF
jgi:mannose-6-phosphate isomerase-like protein (cupin superfamily)